MTVPTETNFHEKGCFHRYTNSLYIHHKAWLLNTLQTGDADLRF